MTHLNFSLTSQCQKTTVLPIVFMTQRANWPVIVQELVNAGSHKLGVKTAEPSADYGPQEAYSR